MTQQQRQASARRRDAIQGGALLAVSVFSLCIPTAGSPHWLTITTYMASGLTAVIAIMHIVHSIRGDDV
jgi:hypothetical protein